MAQKWQRVQGVVVGGGGGLPRDNLTSAEAHFSLQHAVEEWKHVPNDATATALLKSTHEVALCGHSVVILGVKGSLQAVAEASLKYVGKQEIARLLFRALQQLAGPLSAKGDADVESAQRLLAGLHVEFIKALVKACNKHLGFLDVHMGAFRTLTALANCPPCKHEYVNAMLDHGIFDLLTRHLNGNRVAAATSGHLLFALCSSATNRSKLLELGILKMVLATLRHHASEAEVCEVLFRVLRNLDRDMRVRLELVSSGAVELIVTALQTHASNAAVLLPACDELASMCIDDKAAARMVHKGGVEAMNFFVLKTHRADPQLQQLACSVLARLFRTCGTEAIRKIGIVDILDSVVSTISTFKQTPLVVECAGEVVWRLMHDDVAIDEMAKSPHGVLAILINSCSVNPTNAGVHKVTCLVTERLATSASAAAAKEILLAKTFPLESIPRFPDAPACVAASLRCYRLLITHKLKEMRFAATNLEHNMMEMATAAVVANLPAAATSADAAAVVGEGMQCLAALLSSSEFHDAAMRHVISCNLVGLHVKVTEALSNLPDPVIGEKDPNVVAAVAAARELSVLLAHASAGTSFAAAGAASASQPARQPSTGAAAEGGKQPKPPSRSPSLKLSGSQQPEGPKTAMHATQSLKNIMKNGLLAVRRENSKPLDPLAKEALLADGGDLGGAAEPAVWCEVSVESLAQQELQQRLQPQPPRRERSDRLASALLANLAESLSPGGRAAVTPGSPLQPATTIPRVNSGQTLLDAALSADVGETPIQRPNPRAQPAPPRRARSDVGGGFVRFAQDARFLEALVEGSEAASSVPPTPPTSDTGGDGGWPSRSKSAPAPPSDGRRSADSDRSESLRPPTAPDTVGRPAGAGPAPGPPRRMLSLRPVDAASIQPLSAVLPAPAKGPQAKQQLQQPASRQLPALFTRPKLASDTGPAPMRGGSFRVRPPPVETPWPFEADAQDLSPTTTLDEWPGGGGSFKAQQQQQRRTDNSPAWFKGESLVSPKGAELPSPSAGGVAASSRAQLPRLPTGEGRRRFESETGPDLSQHPLFGDAPASSDGGRAGPLPSQAAAASNASSRLVSGPLSASFRDGALLGNLGRPAAPLFKEDGADFLMAMQASSTEMNLIVDVLQRAMPAPPGQAPSRRGMPLAQSLAGALDRDASPVRLPGGGNRLRDGLSASSTNPLGSVSLSQGALQVGSGKAVNIATSLSFRRDRLLSGAGGPAPEPGRQAITPAPPKAPRPLLPSSSLRASLPDGLKIGEASK